MKNLNIELGERITKIRESINKNKSLMAVELNTSIPSLTRYENGEIAPSSDFIIAIIDKYGVNPYWLLKGTGNMFENMPDGARNKVIVEIVTLLKQMDDDTQFEILKTVRKELMLASLLNDWFKKHDHTG